MLKLNPKHRSIGRITSAFLAILAAGILSSGSVWAQSTTLLITQVYGGGGATTSADTYNQDFVELLNISSNPIALDTYAIQYVAATGTTITVNSFPAGLTIQPGHYFLVAGPHGTNSPDLTPTPDTVISTIGIAAAGGRIFLTNSQTKLSSPCPSNDPTVVDFVGIGASTCFEGTGPSPVINATTSVIRTSLCTDTNDNSKDFVALSPPVAHNSVSTPPACAGGGGGTTTAPAVASAAFTPSTVATGDMTILTATVTKGTNTVTSVTADDSAIGGTASDVLHDDGANGDATAGDGVYSFKLANVTAAANTYTVTVTASDNTLTGTHTASLIVQATQVPAVATIALQAPTSVVLGNSVTISAVVTGNKGVPTGTLSFLDGGKALGGGTITTSTTNTVTYTYTTTALALGAHVITATYSGDGVYTGSTTPANAAVTVTITPVPVPTFALTLGNISLIATDHSKVQTTSVNVNMINGFSSAVSFTCSGAPAGTRCSFSPATLTASGSTTLTIGIDGAALHPHDSPFGKRGGETALAFLLLGGLPLALRRKRFSGTLMAALLLGVIALGVTGCGGGNSTPLGTSSVTVTATGGGVTQTAVLSLNVQ